MGLNKQKGNMYPWVDATWNVIKGKCPHDCLYCYMKVYKQPELHFDQKELETDLGNGNVIFVGSSCDMWAKDIPSAWIKSILLLCSQHLGNKYLFQSKDPTRFVEFVGEFPPEFIIGATIETNRDYAFLSKAPATYDRKVAMKYYIGPKMLSLEPVLDFDLDRFVGWIEDIQPRFVSIGADSKGHRLPEPSSDKVHALIESLRQITEVKLKDNLKRIMGG